MEECEPLQDDLSISLDGERVFEADGLGERTLLVNKRTFVQVDGQTLEKLCLTVQISEIHLV